MPSAIEVNLGQVIIFCSNLLKSQEKLRIIKNRNQKSKMSPGGMPWPSLLREWQKPYWFLEIIHSITLTSSLWVEIPCDDALIATFFCHFGRL